MINKLFEISCNSANKLPPLGRLAKTMEELGELSEALMHKLGHLPHKTMKEPLEGEVADVVICAIDTLAGAYPELNATQLADMLQLQLTLKSEKWTRVMIQRGPTGQVV